MIPEFGKIYLYKSEEETIRVRLTEISYRDTDRNYNLFGGRIFHTPLINDKYYIFEPIEHKHICKYPDLIFKEGEYINQIFPCNTIDDVDDLYRI
jgi:hypothetical protein